MMKISLLLPSISSNVVWAATMLARALQEQYSVEIVGPDLGGGVHPMYRGCFDYKAVPNPIFRNT